jgi:phospholipase C
MTDLAQIDTIVVVMMENRSFDHLTGYLSLNNLEGGKMSTASSLT